MTRVRVNSLLFCPASFFRKPFWEIRSINFTWKFLPLNVIQILPSFCVTGGNLVYRFHSKFLSSHKSGGLRTSLAHVTKLKIIYIKFSKVTNSVLSICAARNLFWWSAKLRRCEDRGQGISLHMFYIVDPSV